MLHYPSQIVLQHNTLDLGVDEKLLMHLFQDSLSGATLSWYMN
jgi:hypothetical protein